MFGMSEGKTWVVYTKEEPKKRKRDKGGRRDDEAGVGACVVREEEKG